MFNWFEKKINSFMFKNRMVETKIDILNISLRSMIFFAFPFMGIWIIGHYFQRSTFYGTSPIPFIIMTIAGGLVIGIVRYFSDRDFARSYNVLAAKKNAVIVDPFIRWRKGMEHHPKSIEIYNYISKADFEHGDFFEFKSGGDGDNGEQLMYLLDSYFEKKDISFL